MTPSAVLTAFPPHTRFCHPWRGYQQRVLSELHQHLADGHLHVVAPPGSGKTVLGLEVMRQLDRPTLVLAPTLAIRDQWTQRFCELFLNTATRPDWISHDIRRPALLTVSTYQGLHAASTGAAAKHAFSEDEEDVEEAEEPEEEPEQKPEELAVAEEITTEEIVAEPATEETTAEEAAAEPAAAPARPKRSARRAPLPDHLAALKAIGLGTLILDEAHHLQNAWWKSLMQLKDTLNPVVVSLTATPPYDISAAEWQRYCTLSGPVDAEISVPELLAADDLCPHQDYVCFSTPTQSEGQGIGELHDRLQAAYATLNRDATLVAALEQHPILTDPNGQLDWIYGNLPTYAASLIFLHANGRLLGPEHLAVFGDPKQPDDPIPVLTPEWLETLLVFYLFDKEGFAGFNDHRRAIEKQLRQQGLVENRRVFLRHHPRLSDFLGTSLSKLRSIGRIVAFEHAALGERLRLVVLTDYIRREYLGTSAEHTPELTKIGAMPIFELLRREAPPDLRLGVLTGSLVIVPAAALPALRAAAHPLTVTATPLPYASDYVLLQPSAALQPELVRHVTHLFEQGHIQALIGTKALLGEGWDAPCLNTLVLASFVGSFVLSNQMRGRAIRTQSGQPTKTSNIWHLACLDPLDPAGGPDLALLRRRFRTFVGVSLPSQPLSIENRLARLGIPKQLPPAADVEVLNASMQEPAADRAALAGRWQEGLATGRVLREEIRVPGALTEPLTQLRRRYFTRTLAFAAAELATAIALFGSDALETLLRQLMQGRSLSQVLGTAKLLLLMGLVLFGRQLWRAARLYITYRDISLDLAHIGEALLRTLIYAGTVEAQPALRVDAYAAEDGSVACHLAGGTTFEHSAFARTLEEILQPLANPRYVVVRRSRRFGLLQQQDYHAVPEELGRTRHVAEHFAGQWKERVGECELIYTRTLEGRRQLLHARARALSTALSPTATPASRWQ